MPADTLVPAREFCAFYQLDISFVVSLEAQGILETISIGQVVYLHPDQLAPLEKMIRLHRELSVHLEDLDIVAHLLERLEQAQQQVSQLQHRLAFYEPLARPATY